jgi:PKD repeat protein
VTSTSFSWSFRGTGSTDLDNDITQWSIDFGDGTSTGLQSFITNPPANVPHRYSDQGDYVVRLTVFDSLGASGTDAGIAHIITVVIVR